MMLHSVTGLLCEGLVEKICKFIQNPPGVVEAVQYWVRNLQLRPKFLDAQNFQFLYLWPKYGVRILAH